MDEDLKALGLRAEAALKALDLDKAWIQHRRIRTPGTRRVRNIIDMSSGPTVGIIMMHILKIVAGEYIIACYLPENHQMGQWFIGDEYGDMVAHGQWTRCVASVHEGGPSLLAQGLVAILEDIVRVKGQISECT